MFEILDLCGIKTVDIQRQDMRQSRPVYTAILPSNIRYAFYHQGDAMKRFAALLLAMLFSSSASASWQEVPPRPKPFVLNNFSLTLPDETGWSVNTPLSPDRLLLVKRNHDKDPYENYAIEAYVLNVPIFKSNEDFLRAVKEGRAINSDARYKILNQDIKPYMKNGEYCALAQVEAEDNGRIPSFGFGNHRKSGHMIYEAVTLSCRHPLNKNTALDLTFSLRYYPGERDSLFSEKAMKVVDGVEFRNP